MDSPLSLKKEWVLTKEAFDRLLASLDADREQAAQKYERVRHKMIKYFEWRGASFPDREADETINRVARKVEEGEKIQNFNAYFYRVAWLVFAESLKAREREEAARREASAFVQTEADDDSDAAERRACLDRCLRRLPDENRDLIMEYYQDERGGKIERRKRLASRLGIPLNALRIRAHRIRVGLEACVRECVGQRA
jgi:DNA-directed RNA polymerase specialized sigma24 family protein